MAKIRIGVSGWTYAEWRGPFYPSGLPHSRELEYASRAFPSIELNGSFYGLLRPEHYADWSARTPQGFVFAVKGSRFITHNKKLKDVEAALETFFASGLLELGEKLGPVVWQLPRSARFDRDRLRRFFELLPKRLERRRLRHVIEVRHDSFFVDAFVRMCRRHGIAIAVSDAADWPMFEAVTAGLVYVRLHGHTRTYGSAYSTPNLRRWAAKIRGWRRRGLDVYVYFDNDGHAFAPRDARRLMRLLARGDGEEGKEGTGALGHQNVFRATHSR